MSEVKGLIVTRDRLMLELYQRLADDEGMNLRDFLLKYKLAYEKGQKPHE